jgi:tetrahydromethanopterin S-methyltransferase subunit G
MAETTGLEERVAHIEGNMGQLNKRLDSVEIAVVNLQRTVDERFQEVYRRMDAHHREAYWQMHTHFRWTVGIMFTMWVTIILTILVKLK